MFLKTTQTKIPFLELLQVIPLFKKTTEHKTKPAKRLQSTHTKYYLDSPENV